jgi:hypothetical protein
MPFHWHETAKPANSIDWCARHAQLLGRVSKNNATLYSLQLAQIQTMGQRLIRLSAEAATLNQSKAHFFSFKRFGAGRPPSEDYSTTSNMPGFTDNAN